MKASCPSPEAYLKTFRELERGKLDKKKGTRFIKNPVKEGELNKVVN